MVTKVGGGRAPPLAPPAGAGQRPQRLGLIEGLLNLSGCSLVDRTLSLFGYMCFVVGYFSNVFQFVKVIGKLNILDGAIIFEKVYT